MGITLSPSGRVSCTTVYVFPLFSSRHVNVDAIEFVWRRVNDIHNYMYTACVCVCMRMHDIRRRPSARHIKCSYK